MVMGQILLYNAQQQQILFSETSVSVGCMCRPNGDAKCVFYGVL